MKKDTLLVTSGRNSSQNSGMVNQPLCQSSTILFDTIEEYHRAESGKYAHDGLQDSTDPSYAIAGTPTTFALQEALTKLENGDGCLLASSGLSAITMTLAGLLKTGDHILMVDTVYGPSRRFCNKELREKGVEVTYYDPAINADIAELIQPNTKIIFMESPGSLTFEVQDVSAIVQVAKKNDIITIIDNSWATPLFFNPLDLGVDVVIHAITKYIGGHSDLLLGAIIYKGDKVARRLQQSYRVFGMSASPFNCWLALRGLRSLRARMSLHQSNTEQIIDALKNIPQIEKILYPADSDSPDYELWKSQYKGSASLFSVVLDKKYPQEKISAMIDNMQLFGIGASWGGYESLLINFDPSIVRSAIKWSKDHTYLRFFIGLENADDLIEDIAAGFGRLAD